MNKKSSHQINSHQNQLSKIQACVRDYVIYVMRKQIESDGKIIYSWDDYSNSEGYFDSDLERKYGLQRSEIYGGKDRALVMFMTSRRLAEVFEGYQLSRTITVFINNTTGDEWIPIKSENINQCVARVAVATRRDSTIVDTMKFAKDISEIRFLGDLS
jgi:hypothetical protein